MQNKHWGYLGKVKDRSAPEEQGTRTIRFLTKPPSKEDILDTIYYMRTLSDKSHLTAFMEQVRTQVPKNVYRACEYLVENKGSRVDRDRFIKGNIDLGAKPRRKV